MYFASERRRRPSVINNAGNDGLTLDRGRELCSASVSCSLLHCLIRRITTSANHFSAVFQSPVTK